MAQVVGHLVGGVNAGAIFWGVLQEATPLFSRHALRLAQELLQERASLCTQAAMHN